jgi:hypothetical protein
MLPTNSLAALLLAAALGLSGGCSQMFYNLGEPVSEQAIDNTAPGLTLTQVLQELGPPHRFSSMPDGYVMAWEYWQISEQAVGISLGSLGVDIFSIDFGEANVAGQFLLLSFTREHRLSGQSYSSWQDQIGSGKALQPSFGVVALIDVADLRKPLPQHSWGEQLMLPLPSSLNTANSPDSGQAAIEQRGTPTGAGQRSLEFGD